MAAMQEKVHFEDEYKDTEFIKNLFYWDKKKKDRMWFVLAADSTNIDLKALTKTLGCGSGNLRGASEEALYEFLGARTGALNLFAVFNDKAKKVELVLDKKLTEQFSHVGIHPMDNTATTAVSKESFMQIVGLTEHEPKILDFGAAPAAAAAPAKPQKGPKGQKKGPPQKAKPAADADQRGIEYPKEENFSKWYS